MSPLVREHRRSRPCASTPRTAHPAFLVDDLPGAALDKGIRRAAAALPAVRAWPNGRPFPGVEFARLKIRNGST
jgi:hypothetical protein